MLDMKQPQQMIAQLQKAAQPRPADPELPLKLEIAKRETEHLFAGLEDNPQLWSHASSSGLVHAGLNTLAKWLSKDLLSIEGEQN